MTASCISFGRNIRARKKRMPDPSHPNESVPKQRLRANLRGEGAEHADLQIDLSLSKRARILLGLGRESQADTRRSLVDSCDQGSRKGGDKSFVGANGEGPFERSDVQLADVWAEDRQYVPAQRMDA